MSARPESLGRDRRIRSTREIRSLMREGKRRKTSNFDVFVAASPDSFSRLGVIVPKHGHAIVERNLLRRRIREVGRRELLPGLETCGRDRDVLVRARPSAYEAAFATLRDEIIDLTRQLCSESSS